jgi:hypothetical protein
MKKGAFFVEVQIEIVGGRTTSYSVGNGANCQGKFYPAQVRISLMRSKDNKTLQ